jgi:hypothetical protein
MSWTVIIEDENGNVLRKLSKDFTLSNNDQLYNSQFRLLKYLDLFGDTVFNRLMLDDLIAEFLELKAILPSDKDQIDEVIGLANDCKKDIHSYIKFYGD